MGWGLNYLKMARGSLQHYPCREELTPAISGGPTALFRSRAPHESLDHWLRMWISGEFYRLPEKGDTLPTQGAQAHVPAEAQAQSKYGQSAYTHVMWLAGTVTDWRMLAAASTLLPDHMVFKGVWKQTFIWNLWIFKCWNMSISLSTYPYLSFFFFYYGPIVGNFYI